MTTSEIKSALSKTPLYGKDFLVTGCSPVPTTDIRHFKYADSLRESLHKFFTDWKSSLKSPSDGQEISIFYKNVFDLAERYNLVVRCGYSKSIALYVLYLNETNLEYTPAEIAFKVKPKEDVFLESIVDVVAASYK